MSAWVIELLVWRYSHVDVVVAIEEAILLASLNVSTGNSIPVDRNLVDWPVS